jgi:hypothetical protein
MMIRGRSREDLRSELEALTSERPRAAKRFAHAAREAG